MYILLSCLLIKYHLKCSVLGILQKYYMHKSFHETRCRRSQQLRGHGVGVVNNYADTSMTMITLFENFEGFSQILKEQLGKKGIWVCLHIQ